MLQPNATEAQTDVLIVGAGLGGCAAALAAARLGRRVILTEETAWIGGQLTSQAVPPDEHPWIEETGCTASYRRLRNLIRDYYRRNYPLKPEVRQQVQFNPGQGLVSRLCHEPRVALAALGELFAPFISSGQVVILREHTPVSASTDGDRVQAVTLERRDGSRIVISAPYVIDGTELGDLLELAGVEHVTGAESQAQTGEMHALPGDPDPLDQQAVTWCFAMDYLPDEVHTIARPNDYDFWRTNHDSFWPGPQLSWQDVNPFTMGVRSMPLFGVGSEKHHLQPDNRWEYRRILYTDHHLPGRFASDVTLVNWPQNDYWQGPLIGVSAEEKTRHLRGAMQLSYALLYWMQTEAPRHDGGQGYPGLRLRGDLTGTEHGLAMAVYVREARRIQAEFTILEEHVGVEQRGDRVGAAEFDDSVGIGSYRIDLHPSTAQRSYIDLPSWPAQIALGALLPVRVENLLPANKNLGVTHITNGCYRLHPVEWNIGEAAGALAAYCLEHDLTPRQVRNTQTHLRDFQSTLVHTLGVPLEWPAYARKSPRDGTSRGWRLHAQLGAGHVG